VRTLVWLVIACAVGISATAQPAGPAFAIDADAAIVTVFIRPTHTAAFDKLLERVRTALASTPGAARQSQVDGWQIFQALDVGQGNTTYVMRIDPAVKGREYDLTRIIGGVAPDQILEFSRAYREAQSGRSVMTMNRVAIAGLGNAADRSAPAPGKPALEPRLAFRGVEAVIVTILVKSDQTAAFEAVMVTLGKAMQSSPVAGRKRQAAGMKIFKGVDLFDGSVPYVMTIDPVEADAEYDVVRLIQEAFPNQITQVFEQYRTAFVGQAVIRLGHRFSMAR